jgi:hypothetical protein
MCGQKTDTRRLGFRQLFVDFLQAFINLEKGLLRLFSGLMSNPGGTAADYAAGERKKYFNPFAFMGLCIAVMIFINGITKPYTVHYIPDPVVLERIGDPITRQLYIESVERMEKVNRFINKNMNIISTLISPYFALFLWLFFKKQERNMAEITVAYILFAAFSNLASAILLSPVLSAARNSKLYNPLLYTLLLLQTLYIAWGMKSFFRLSTVTGYFKVLGVLVLAGFAGFILVLIAYYFYVYQGGSSVVLRYL